MASFSETIFRFSPVFVHGTIVLLLTSYVPISYYPRRAKDSQ